MSLPSLDHLVLFLPHSAETGFPVIPPSVSNAFTLTPGGHHADGLTSNTLIILADGCYLELRTFLPQPANSDAVSKHWWGPSSTRTGWTDWCLTSPLSPTDNHSKITSSHAAPINGGRKRPDGKEVKWAVTFPHGEKGGQQTRGKIPFWCHDTTPRELRVPVEKEKVTHPNGVLGVEELNVVVKDKEGLEALAKVYEGVVGLAVKKDSDEVVFQLGRVVGVEGLSSGAKVVLRLPKNEEEIKKVDERDFWFGDVVLAAEAGVKSTGTLERIDADQDGIGGVWVKSV